MKQYQERVVEERELLDENREKLSDFIGSDAFDSVDDSERMRLVAQADAMLYYSVILNERIEAF